MKQKFNKKKVEVEVAEIAADSSLKTAFITSHGIYKAALVTIVGSIIVTFINNFFSTSKSVPSTSNSINITNSENTQVVIQGEIKNKGISKEEFNKLLSINGNNIQQNLDIKDLYKEIEKIKNYNKSNINNRNKPDIDKIEVALGQGKLKEAQKLAEINVTRARNSLAPSLYISAFLKTKNLEVLSAYKDIKEALELDPNNIVYLTLISNISFSLKEIKKSIEYHKKILKLALKTEPSDAALIFMSRFNLATILLFNNDYFQATFQIKEALKIAPKNSIYESSAFFLMSKVYSKADKIKESESYLNKAINNFANSKEVSPEALAKLFETKAEILGEKGHIDEVIKNLLIATDIIQAQPNMKSKNTKKSHDSFLYLTEIYLKIAGVYFIDKKYSQAFEFANKSLERGITISGEDSRLASRSRHIIGNVYYVNGNYNKSIQYLKTALKGYQLNFKNGHILFPLIKSEIGKSLSKLGKKKEAIPFYKESLTSFLKVNNKQVNQVIEIAIMQNTIADLLVSEKVFQEAINYYNSSISTFERINKQDHDMYEVVKQNLIIAKKSLH